jgi:hypothetical protein
VRRVLAFLLGAAVLVDAPGAARASGPLFGAFVEAAGGIDLAGGKGIFLAQRSRTQVRLGATLRLDGLPRDALFVAALVEVEPRPSLGFDVQWAHHVLPVLSVQAGVTGVAAPETLFGVTGGARLRIPLGSRFRITAGPQVSGYFLGGDLPDGSVIVQTLLLLGTHVDF